jgi:hypothetical protein
MAKKFPIRPAHPERNCWGCDEYCPSNAMRCGNGSERTQHPAELFGDDWADWIAGAPPADTPEPDADAAPGAAGVVESAPTAP